MQHAKTVTFKKYKILKLWFHFNQLKKYVPINCFKPSGNSTGYFISSEND